MRRRSLLKTAALLPLGARVVSAAPAAETVTLAMVEAAKKEGTVTYYTAMDLSVAEPLAKAFEAKYPGIKVKVELTGAERLCNRIRQEAGEREGAGGPVGHRAAQASRGRRARHRRRRQRLSLLAGQGARLADRGGAGGRRHAADQQSHGCVQSGAQSQCRAPAGELDH